MNATNDVYSFCNESEKLQICFRSYYDVMPSKKLLDSGLAYMAKLTKEVDVVCPILS